MNPETKWQLVHRAQRAGAKFNCPDCDNEYLLVGDYTEPCFRCYACHASEIPGIDFYDRLLEFLKENNGTLPNL